MSSQQWVPVAFDLCRVSALEGSVHRHRNPSAAVQSDERLNGRSGGEGKHKKPAFEERNGGTRSLAPVDDATEGGGAPQDWVQTRDGQEMILGTGARSAKRSNDEERRDDEVTPPSTLETGSSRNENRALTKSFAVTRLVSQKLVKQDQYEGGLQIWECTWDLLIALLRREELLGNNFDFKGKVVLELGCGHGLPGLLALQEGATEVVFQDLNDEVIRNATQKNVILSLKSGGRIAASHWKANEVPSWKPQEITVEYNGSGKVSQDPEAETSEWRTCPAYHMQIQGSEGFQQDCWTISCRWETLPDLLRTLRGKRRFCIDKATQRPCASSITSNDALPERLHETGLNGRVQEPSGFDLILSAESVYREESFPAILHILDHCLGAGGVALFSAKRYYFGIGGGSLPFRSFLLEQTKNKCRQSDLASPQKATSSSQCTLAAHEEQLCNYDVEILCSFVDKASNVRDVLIVRKT